MGLPDKRPRALTLALTAVGVLVAAVLLVGAFLVATGGSDDGASAKKSLNTDFKEPQKFDLDEVYDDSGFSCEARDTMCVRKFLVGVTADYGPRASLPVLERLQREQRVDLSVNDHDLAHAVGRETAKDFGSNFDAFDLCPTIFNYGCSHGFFEYVLARTDTPKQAATTVCETVSGDKKRLLISGFSCYHGVGHGVMMAQAYDVQESLNTCNTLPTLSGQGGLLAGRLHGERQRRHERARAQGRLLAQGSARPLRQGGQAVQVPVLHQPLGLAHASSRRTASKPPPGTACT